MLFKVFANPNHSVILVTPNKVRYCSRREHGPFMSLTTLSGAIHVGTGELETELGFQMRPHQTFLWLT